MIMQQGDQHSSLTYSYLALRKAVGWIGILLPFVLMLGGHLIFKEDFALKNISVYYYTGMRNVFVGSLCAISLFLFFYKGYDKWDNRMGSLAGFFALILAFFPTVEDGPYDWQAHVHFYSAACLFIILSGISLFLFTKKVSFPTNRKLKRNRIYIICGSLMIASLIAAEIFIVFFDDDHPKSTFVFWAETVTLLAFGVSWLTKGGTLYPDKMVINDLTEPTEKKQPKTVTNES
jgi:hypothetical protein